jgi:DNA invertase Pin-like site-specific DNA recombinase
VRAAIYVRVSTEDQAEGSSLDEQERLCRARADAEGWSVARVYQDVQSGADDSRRDLNRLLRELDQIDRLIIWKLDRLGRRTRRLLEVEEQLTAAGVALVSLSESLDTSTPAGKFTFITLGGIAELERETIRARTGMGRAALARDGLWGTGSPPYGFRGLGEGQITRDDDEAPWVAEIFRLRRGGLSHRRIALRLDELGVPTRDGRPWHRGSIRKLLENETYLGLLKYKGELLPGKHPALVSQEDFDAVQSHRESQQRQPGGGPGRAPAKSFLLAGGMLHCGCGSIMSPRSDTDSYRCLGRMRSTAACSQPPLPRGLVDPNVTRYLADVILNLEASVQRAREATDRHLAMTSDLARQAQRDVARSEDWVNRIEQDYRNGDLSGPRYEQKIVQAEQELAADQDKALRMAEQAAALRDEPHLVEDVEALQEALRAPLAEADTTVDALRVAISQVFLHFDVEAVDPSRPLDQRVLDLLAAIPHAVGETGDDLPIVSVDKPTPLDYFLLPRPREGVDAAAVERQALTLHNAPAAAAAGSPAIAVGGRSPTGRSRR